MENKMKEVAKLLGDELEEGFRINVSPLEFKLTKSGLLYWSNASQMWERSRSIEELLIGQYEIIKIQKPILDDKEKEYLSNTIKPFRDRIDYIAKVNLANGKEYIFIKMKNYEKISLPFFKAGTMYKGMQSDKEYTLDELEL